MLMLKVEIDTRYACTDSTLPFNHILHPILHRTQLDTNRMSNPSSEIPAPLVPILASITAISNILSDIFHRLPGSPILLRYIKSSYQNDPWRSLLEVLLVAFALRTVLKGRTRGDGQTRGFIKFSEKVLLHSHITVIARVVVETYCSYIDSGRKRLTDTIRIGDRRPSG